jgi:hypothetical protein
MAEGAPETVDSRESTHDVVGVWRTASQREHLMRATLGAAVVLAGVNGPVPVVSAWEVC